MPFSEERAVALDKSCEKLRDWFANEHFCFCGGCLC